VRGSRGVGVLVSFGWMGFGGGVGGEAVGVLNGWMENHNMVWFEELVDRAFVYAQFRFVYFGSHASPISVCTLCRPAELVRQKHRPVSEGFDLTAGNVTRRQHAHLDAWKAITNMA
jgi:hypothetical protein